MSCGSVPSRAQVRRTRTTRFRTLAAAGGGTRRESRHLAVDPPGRLPCLRRPDAHGRPGHRGGLSDCVRRGRNSLAPAYSAGLWLPHGGLSRKDDHQEHGDKDERRVGQEGELRAVVVRGRGGIRAGVECRVPKRTVPTTAMPSALPARWAVPRTAPAAPASLAGTRASTRSWFGVMTIPLPSPASSSGPTRLQLLGTGALSWITNAARASPAATIKQPVTSTIRPVRADSLSLTAAETRLPNENGMATSPVTSALRPRPSCQKMAMVKHAGEAGEVDDREDRTGAERWLGQDAGLEQRVRAGPLSTHLPPSEQREHDHACAEGEITPRGPAVLPTLDEGNEQEEQPRRQQYDPDRVESPVDQ